MADDEDAHQIRMITLAGRIVSVAVDLDSNDITLQIEIDQDPLPPFMVNAGVPCSKKLLRAEYHWYTQLRKRKRLLEFKGAFTVVDGVIELERPTIAFVHMED